jgi:phage shock protein A
MSLQLTADELCELALAIDAYKEALERFNNTGSANSSIRALQTAREKINRAYRESENANPVPRRYAAGHAAG